MTTPQRRTDIERTVVGDYYDGVRRYYDSVAEKTVVKIFSGGYYVTEEKDEMIITILGSCIAACIRDPLLCIGGMNHFLLPTTGDTSADNMMRFGSFAMEQLINELIKLGARKERMEVKIFGGGAVVPGLSDIGLKNIQFVKKFLADEEMKIAAEDVGGPFPRRVHYEPDTGKVRLRKLRRREDLVVADKEQNYLSSVVAKPTEGEVELFG